MKKFCKIISIFIVGLFCIMTIPVNHFVENAKADEVDLDTEFIDDILNNLTSVASSTYWMGRDFGTEGERYAAERLRTLWNNTIAGGNFKYIEESDLEKIDKGTVFDSIDRKIGIFNKDDYKLNINGEDINPNCCYPYVAATKYRDKEFTVRIPDDAWYGPVENEKKDNELFMMEIEEQLKKGKILSEVKYVLLKDCTGVIGDVVYIEDYDSASINETEGKIHLINIEQNANDDVFKQKIDKVYNSNGTAFIAIVTNPSFINNLNTSVPGIVISRFDGEKIKQSLINGDSIYVNFNDDSFSTEGTIQVIRTPACLTRYIYLCDMSKYTTHDFSPRDSSEVSLKIWLKSLPLDGKPPASAFLYKDINYDTHLFYTGCVAQYDKYKIFDLRKNGIAGNPLIIPTHIIPGFGINKTIGDEIQENDKVTLTNWFIIEEDALMYNVIGEYDNPNSTDIIIVTGHYDGFYGQCALDDAAAVAGVWGVAKCIKDNGYEPECDIKFIAFTGEESSYRGSNFYVWNHIINGDEEGKIKAVINLDPIAINTTMIDSAYPPMPLNAYIYINHEIKGSQKIKILRILLIFHIIILLLVIQ